MDQVAATRLIRDSLLGERASTLAPLMRESVVLETRFSSMSAFAIGDTRVGGDPDVPPGFEWPRHRDRPLTFLAQIRLADVAALLGDGRLPATGFLFFFYDRGQAWGFDPADRGAGVVLYSDCAATDLRRASPPPEEDDEYEPDDADSASFAPCEVTLRPRLELPDEFDSVLVTAGLALDDDESEAYAALQAAISGAVGGHHLFGYPQMIQNEMRLKCQLVSNGIFCGDGSGYQNERARELAAGAADWQLLFQVDTDVDGPGWMWGDRGRLYFWIRSEDLANRRFERTWTVLQCG